jgi:hypothetical protein
MPPINRRLAMRVLGGLLMFAGAGPTAAPVSATPAEVNYSALYWELLDRYASVEATWATIRGVYGSDPECLLLQQQGEPVGCGQIIAVLLPDATFGGGWIEDPAAPDGWREPSGSECMTIDWATVDNPDRWALACGYW